ncbi:GntR family transcriptional regulator [Clostridium sp. UBA1652]|uniref:GntR family transcriptional regulator n=1 Tax=Clostridium sp. UBA1652 TaxID=1946348 RepID=UPI00257D4681|nr:GntR family transcriptional regulator [Clostridium sp. UBA1652]
MLKYVEIANDIRDKILQEVYIPNEQLPFEKDLGEQYKASKMTVKKALDMLVAEGLIVKRRGAGTFVKDVQIKDIQRLLLSSQFEGLTASNYKHEVTSQVIEFAVIPANEDICEKLKLEPDSFVYKIIRLRLIDGKPTVIEETYMPLALMPNFKKSILEGSIYEYIEDTLGYKIQSAHRTIHVRKATPFEIEHLRLEENDPIADVQQVGFLDNGQPFEYSLSFHHYSFYEFKTVIIK